jgi:hypothetical protein
MGASEGLSLSSLAPLPRLRGDHRTSPRRSAFRRLVASATGGQFLVANAYMCVEALKIRREISKAAVLTTLSDLLRVTPCPASQPWMTLCTSATIGVPGSTPSPVKIGIRVAPNASNVACDSQVS